MTHDRVKTRVMIPTQILIRFSTIMRYVLELDKAFEIWGILLNINIRTILIPKVKFNYFSYQFGPNTLHIKKKLKKKKLCPLIGIIEVLK